MRLSVPILRRLPAAARRRAVPLLFCALLLLAGTVGAMAATQPAPPPPPPPFAAADDSAATDTDPPRPAGVLDQALLLSVIRTALDVMMPRTLEPHTAAELTGWGLNGFAAIDPGLAVSVVGPRITLSNAGGALFSATEPPPNDVPAWSALAVDMAQAAWTASPAVRDAGQQAVIQSFFDELFNHLDPYSRYVAPAPAETERTARSGGQAGAGLTVLRDKGSLLVTAVSANGPAWSAGIPVGARLLAVDGQSVRSRDVDSVQAMLSGDSGTSVTLSLVLPGQRHATRFTLVRAAVPPETVFAFTNGDLVVLRITGFSSDTALEMSQFLSEATGADVDGDPSAPAPHRHRLHGLIIDLRGNRGGLLQQAVTSVALVLDHGVAVTTSGRDPQSNHVWAVQGGDLTNGVPIVVLVDGRTASAAEIMAAALSDHRRAVVIGSATLGKGLVQFLAQMPDGGELFVTWSRVLAPLGWPLQGLGVMPELCTGLGLSRTETQLQDLAAGRWDMRQAVVDSRAARAPLPAARILELRAPCPAAIGGDDDIDAARALLDTPGAWEAALVPQPREPALEPAG